MPDYLPFEIQAEIIKRLPVKSLIRLRSVSQAWKSLIESSRFIAENNGHLKQVPCLLVRYRDPADYEYKYVSIVDDDTFPQQKASLTVPLSVKMFQLFKDYKIIGSSHGLLCLYSMSSINGRRKDVIVLWNITIRKAITVVVPNVGNWLYGIAIGFGVCGETSDTKIVKVTYINNCMIRWAGMESDISIPYQVEVFTSNTGAWRSPRGNLPRKSVHFTGLDGVAMDGVFYWLATDRITIDGGFRFYHLIVSFDMTSEEFIDITLPDYLAHLPSLSYEYLSLYKLKESLVVVEHKKVIDNFVVWMMRDGIPKSFTKLFTIPSHGNVLAPGFRNSGEPIIEISYQGRTRGRLVVYEPYSKHINNIWIDGRADSFSVYPYTETLLLLDQPDRKVYDNI